MFKKLLFPLFALVFMFTACQKDSLIDEGGVIVPTDEKPGIIETNPLVSRSSGSTVGLDLGCFLINYPFKMVDVDGTEYSIDSLSDLEILETDETVIADFVYPLNISLENGDETTIDDIDGLAELFAECLPEGGWEDGDFPAYLINPDNSCYTLQYPLDLQNIDGEAITINDETEFNGTIAEDVYFFVFPVTLIDEDGNTIVTENNDDIFEALFACNDFEPGDTTVWDWETGFEYIGCYMIELPLDVLLEDGTTVTVNSHEELCDLMLTGSLAGYAYPLTLIDENGDEVDVNSEDELDELLNDCWDFELVDDGFFTLFTLFEGATDIDQTGICFEISFPLTIDYENEDDVVLNSLDEMISFTDNLVNPEFSVVYPITLTMTADSSVVVVEDFEDLIVVVSECQ